MVRFSLCVDERGSFKVVSYLLKNAVRISKREKDTRAVYMGKTTSSMFLLEGFSCTCNEHSEQYWSI